MKKLISLILALALCLALGTTAMASQDEDELFTPLDWFGDWPSGTALMRWDHYGDDENATALILHFSKEPQSGVELFEAYTDQLNECDDLRCVAEKEFFSGFSGSDNDTDREILYRYTGREDVGTVTALQSGESCDFAVHQVWLEADYLVLILAWGENFPMEIDPEDVDEADGSLSGDNVLPDAWAFFNEEMTHYDKLVTNGTSVSFSLDGGLGEACYEYMDLLTSGRFGFTLTETWDKNMGGGKTVYYLFDYPGAGEDAEVSSRLDGKDRSADLIVQINDWVGEGWCDLFIRYSDVLTVEDTGDRCTVTGLREWGDAHFTGPMGSGASGSDAPAPPSDPSSPGHWEWRTVEKDCPSCVGGSCPVCHGTGTCRLYGEEVPCDRYCSACDGRGTIIQQEYVFVND